MIVVRNSTTLDCLTVWTGIVWVVITFVVAVENLLIGTLFPLITIGKILPVGKGTILPAFIGFIFNVLARSSKTYLHIQIQRGTLRATINYFPSFSF